MLWWRWFVFGLVAGFSLLAFVWRGGTRADVEVADFVDRFDQATVQRPNAGVFSITAVQIAGISRPAIVAAQASRLAWDVEATEGLWLEVDLGVGEAAWVSDDHAVLFRVGVSYGTQFEDLTSQVVNPSATTSDRQWIPVRLDLSPYAGRSVSLIFNTAAAPGTAGTHLHHAVWGQPRLVQR
jgi:hypothetical protein